MRSHRLLQLDDNKSADNKFDCQDALSTSLMQVVSTTRSKSANTKLHKLSLIFTDQVQVEEVNMLTCCNLMTNLHQAGKIHNLHQLQNKYQKIFGVLSRSKIF